jgi:hypothetical protein
MNSAAPAARPRGGISLAVPALIAVYCLLADKKLYGSR